MEKSGLASIQLLVSKGAVVTATDLKPLSELAEAEAMLNRLNVPFAQQTAESLAPSPQSPAPFPDHDVIVLSPGVPADLPALEAARARGVRVIGEVELAAPFLLGRTIGITGTNGKTTTTALVGHILRAVRHRRRRWAAISGRR